MCSTVAAEITLGQEATSLPQWHLLQRPNLSAFEELIERSTEEPSSLRSRIDLIAPLLKQSPVTEHPLHARRGRGTAGTVLSHTGKAPSL